MFWRFQADFKRTTMAVHPSHAQHQDTKPEAGLSWAPMHRPLRPRQPPGSRVPFTCSSPARIYHCGRSTPLTPPSPKAFRNIAKDQALSSLPTTQSHGDTPLTLVVAACLGRCWWEGERMLAVEPSEVMILHITLLFTGAADRPSIARSHIVLRSITSGGCVHAGSAGISFNLWLTRLFAPLVAPCRRQSVHSPRP
jgi:hypothetical protein